MNDFEKAKKEFINDYIEKKFPKDLQELYGNIIGILIAGIEAGIRFAKQYYKIEK
jgi:hypothetical protein